MSLTITKLPTTHTPWEDRRLRIARSGRLRFKQQLGHVPNGRGKWENMRTLWAYKMKTRRLRNIAEASRARNRRG
jgi:hypothetical protein